MRRTLQLNKLNPGWPVGPPERNALGAALPVGVGNAAIPAVADTRG